MPTSARRIIGTIAVTASLGGIGGFRRVRKPYDREDEAHQDRQALDQNHDESHAHEGLVLAASQERDSRPGIRRCRGGVALQTSRITTGTPPASDWL